MPANNRIFWAIEAVGLAKLGSSTYTAIHGLQSCGMTTSFNLEQVFELGQIEVYENIEGIPEVELTLEKVLDGYPLIYHLATRGYPSNDLVGRSNQRCSAALSIFGDTQNAASGTPIAQTTLSGLYVSSLGYTFPVDGNCTESVTLVGNNQTWKLAAYDFTGGFTNADQPLALTSGLGGVQRRENVLFVPNNSDVTRDANGSVITTVATILPSEIEGISTSGTNNRDSAGQYGCHVQSISVSTDLGREQILELGRLGPYFRYATFPVEVTCDIEIIALKGPVGISAYEESGSLSDKSIRVATTDSTFINLGTKNKLSNVTFGGGDAGGGNATTTYSYVTYNSLVITHPQDPVA
jgi:hypothetical protein